MLRVVGAIEFNRGHRWNQDEWFETPKHMLSVGMGYGVSRIKDKDELELWMAKPIMNGLSIRSDPDAVTPTAGVEEGSHGSEQGGPTPIAQPRVPQRMGQTDSTSSLRPFADAQYNVMDSGRGVRQNAEDSDLDQRTGVRIERDVRDLGGQQESGPRSRAGSFHSARSAQRDQRVADLESQMEGLIKELERRERPQPERHHGDEVSF